MSTAQTTGKGAYEEIPNCAGISGTLTFASLGSKAASRLAPSPALSAGARAPSVRHCASDSSDATETRSDIVDATETKELRVFRAENACAEEQFRLLTRSHLAHPQRRETNLVRRQQRQIAHGLAHLGHYNVARIWTSGPRRMRRRVRLLRPLG